MDFLLIMKDFGLGILSFLILEAGKHIFAKTFNLGVFFSSNIKPLIWSVAGAIVLTALSVWFPQSMPFVETQVGGEYSTDFMTLLALGGVMGGVIKAAIESNNIKNKK